MPIPSAPILLEMYTENPMPRVRRNRDVAVRIKVLSKNFRAFFMGDDPLLPRGLSMTVYAVGKRGRRMLTKVYL